MHNNFYFLKQLSWALREKVIGYTVAEIFSQNKNELIIGLTNGQDDFFIRAYLNPDFSCLVFPQAYSRANRNSISLFQELIQLTVEDVVQLENERSFYFSFSTGYKLLFKMHGNRSNLILIKGKVISVFRNNLVKDFQIEIEKLNRPINQSQERFQEEEGDYNKLFPTFGPTVKDYLKQMGFYNEESLTKQWGILQKTVDQLQAPTFYIIRINGAIHLSLIKLGDILEEKLDPIEAINDFFYTYSRTNFLEKEKVEIVKSLERQVKQSNNYLENTKKKLHEIESGTSNEEIANIIMANLHQITSGKEEVELLNFYDEKNIKIKLKKDLSPQKNAESYYRKGKNQKIETDRLYQNILAKEQEVKNLEHHILHIQKLDEVKALRAYIKEHQLTLTHQKQEEVLPYKDFLIEGYSVWVGKNAISNDLLTLKYAKKDDLWLHAKDVSGSHVVIKTRPGKEVPKNVIEKAAQLAAYYSKRKTDSLCPVTVTPKKFVRKRKGAAAGAVVVDKEEVILVKPANYKNIIQ